MRALSGALAVALVALSAAGCAQLAQLQAMKAFKAANAAYQAQDYKKAATLYEEALAANPNLAQAYFFLGNSYDNQFKPSRKGEADNDVMLTKAVEYYQKAADALGQSPVPEEKKIGKLALEYLVAAYGVDKLADFDKAEPIAAKLISLEPNEPGNYQSIGKLYEDQGRYEEAEAKFNKAIEVRPNDPLGYMILAGFHNRQGNFEKTMDAWEKRAKIEPNNPEAHHMIAFYLYEKAFKDYTLSAATKKDMLARSIEAEDRALALNGDYVEALTIKNIVLRMQANAEKDPKKQKALIDEADRLRNKAMAVQKAQSSSAAATDAAAKAKTGGKGK